MDPLIWAASLGLVKRHQKRFHNVHEFYFHTGTEYFGKQKFWMQTHFFFL